MKNVPFICLSDKCDIIDLSDEIRSCPGKTVDRTLLLFSMSESDAERLVEFCATPAMPYETSLSSISNSEHFNLKFHEYRYAVAEKSLFASGVITLYLYRDKDDLSSQSSQKVPISKGLDEYGILRESFGNLSLDDRFIDISEVAGLIARTADSLIPHGIISSSKLKVVLSDNCRSTPSVHGNPINSSFLLSTFISLISILDSISIGREITVNINSRGDSFEVVMSTYSSDATPPLIGSVGRVLSLAPYIPGSFTDLLVASYSAEMCSLRISTECSPDGEMKFTFSRMAELIPPLEFKCSPPNEFAERLIEDVIRAISAVKEKQNQYQQQLTAVLTTGNSEDY